jgi:hypothetical protein
MVIGANCKLIAHVHVTARTTIGDAARSIHSSRWARRRNP